MIKLRILTLFSVLTLVSCQGTGEETTVLPRQKFTSLLIQMHILEADFSFNQRLDQQSIEKSYTKYEDLFKRFNTDSTTVSATFDHYIDKQEELLDIYRDVLDSLNLMALKSQSGENPK